MLLTIAVVTGVTAIALHLSRYHMSPVVPVLCVVSLACTFAS